MSEPDPLDDGYPGCHRPQWGRGWVIAGRIIDWMEQWVRRGIARPASSAVAIAALGVIVAVVGRAMFVHHSGPASAAGAAIHSVPQEKRRLELILVPAAKVAPVSKQGMVIPKSPTPQVLEERPQDDASTFGDLIDDRDPAAK